MLIELFEWMEGEVVCIYEDGGGVDDFVPEGNGMKISMVQWRENEVVGTCMWDFGYIHTYMYTCMYTCM